MNDLLLSELTKPTKPAEIMPPDQFHLARTAVRAEYQKIVEFGKTIAVIDDDSRNRAAEVGRLLQTAGKELTDFYKPIKKSFDDAKKVILDAEKADLAEIDQVKAALASAVLKYQTEQERIRREADRLARIEAQKAEEERRLLEALELAASGHEEEALAQLDEAPLPPPAIISAGPTKVAGFVQKTRYKAVVEDFPALVKAVAQGKVSIAAVVADQSWLNKQADQYAHGLQIPGVSVQQEVSSHFRS